MNTASGFNMLAAGATFQVVRALVPEYDFFQKDECTAVDTGVGECGDVAKIAVALNPNLALVRHVTKTVSGKNPAYVHYLALDRMAGILIHSSGAPLTKDGAHVKIVPIDHYAFGWSEAGESRGKPDLSTGILKDICEGSDLEARSRSKYKISMEVVEPEKYLKHVGTEELATRALARYYELERSLE